MNIVQNNKWEALFNFLREKEGKTHRREKRKETKKIVRLRARVLNSRPSCFPIQYANALSQLNK